MPTGRPQSDEYFEYYGTYIRQVPEDDPLPVMEQQAGITQALLAGVTQQESLHRYAADKWSIREVVGHLCDVERCPNGALGVILVRAGVAKIGQYSIAAEF